MTDNTFIFPIIRQDFIFGALASLDNNAGHEHKRIVINQTQGRPGAAFESNLRHMADVVVSTRLNYGFAQAANIGTRLATTEFVTICNDDVVFFWDGWWQGIMDTFTKFPLALGVAPMSPKEPGYGYGEQGFRLHIGRKVIQGVPHEHELHQRTLAKYAKNPVGWVDQLKNKFNGAVIDGIMMWCVTLRRQEWIDLGMFDERFMPGGGEDYDACSRAYQSGCRVLASSLSWVWHHWGYSKDHPTGFKSALPLARPQWNKLSTKGFGADGLWDPDCDVWGRTGERIDKNVRREQL